MISTQICAYTETLVETILVEDIMLKLIERILPSWAMCTEPDPLHSHARRYTTKYRRKQNMVKNLWIGMGVVMIALPSLSFIAALSLLTTFVSFIILDETD